MWAGSSNNYILELGSRYTDEIQRHKRRRATSCAQLLTEIDRLTTENFKLALIQEPRANLICAKLDINLDTHSGTLYMCQTDCEKHIIILEFCGQNLTVTKVEVKTHT